MKSQISVSYRDSGIESIQEFCMGKSHSPANLLHLRRFFLSKVKKKVKCITLPQHIHEKYRMVLVPGRTIRHNKLIQFSLCLWWCALQLRNSAAGLYGTCEKHIQI